MCLLKGPLDPAHLQETAALLKLTLATTASWRAHEPVIVLRLAIRRHHVAVADPVAHRVIVLEILYLDRVDVDILVDYVRLRKV